MPAISASEEAADKVSSYLNHIKPRTVVELTGHFPATIVRVILRFHASFSARTELSNIDTTEAVFAFAVPELLFRC